MSRCNAPGLPVGHGQRAREEATGDKSSGEATNKVEAAGIEPGQLDDLGAVSPRHLAQVRDPPMEMGDPSALSRVTSRHPAGNVDQRDHGGPAQRSQPRSHPPGQATPAPGSSSRTVRPRKGAKGNPTNALRSR